VCELRLKIKFAPLKNKFIGSHAICQWNRKHWGKADLVHIDTRLRLVRIGYSIINSPHENRRQVKRPVMVYASRIIIGSACS
jgi:hypothetical protein